jgi:hypothetical protein
MLILGREAPEAAGVGSEVAEPAAAFVSEVEVMQHILVAATDTMTRGPLRRLQELATRAARKSGRRLRATKEANLAARSSACTPQRTMPRGPLITIEPMTMRPARIATRPDLARHRRASA